ncbi:MAG: DNA topoisomerase, partial [Sulfurimonas sp.]
DNKHIVNFYQSETKEVKPYYKPIALSLLQSKMFYLYHFSIEYTTKIAKRLYHAGLITDPLTSSHHIPPETSIKLIRYLNVKYSEEYVLQHERLYKDSDEDTTRTAILPTRFEEAYDPENVEHTSEFHRINFDTVKMRNDAVTMYSLIFAITEWIQMKDAIYDSSILQIRAGNKKLEVKSNCLIDVYDPESGTMVEQKCWKGVNEELLCALVAGDEEVQNKGHTVILPKCSFGEVLQMIDVDFSVSKPKRPRRFGVGRFNTQILGAKGIGTAESFHIIQNNLISSGLIAMVKDMMHPNEIAMETIEWCESYAPLFLDEKNVVEYWERLNRIRFDGEDPQQLINEYEFLINEMMKESGSVSEQSQTLSEGQIKLAKAIVIQKKIRIDNPESFYADPQKVKHLIDLYGNEELKEEEKLFKCPICRQGYVFEKEFIDTETGEVSPYYACEHHDCFRIFDSKIDEFFLAKKKNFDKSERLEALTSIASKQHLKNRGYLFSDFIGKNGRTYETKVFIDTFVSQSGKKSYVLKLDF